MSNKCVPTAHDMACAAKVLVGDDNWRNGPKLPAIAAFLFGARERFEHLDLRCTVAWHKGKPYLISVREA